MPQSYAHFLSTSSSLPPSRDDTFDQSSHIHVPPHLIPSCPPSALDDRFGTCFRLKAREGEWGRESIWGRESVAGGVNLGGLTKGDLLGVLVILVVVMVGWAVVGVFGWVLGRRRGRRERVAWRRGREERREWERWEGYGGGGLGLEVLRGGGAGGGGNLGGSVLI
ncbi:hypothetical protein VE02_09145 [Pseudogymnoascus sp. 03VT05]|nr:hypothetical protein VE02_09145 [Pseudogymnoascus sp. 03VT05]